MTYHNTLPHFMHMSPRTCAPACHLQACHALYFCGTPVQFTGAIDEAGREISKATQETSGLTQENTTIKKSQADGKPAFEGMSTSLATQNYATFFLHCSVHTCAHVNLAMEYASPCICEPCLGACASNQHMCPNLTFGDLYFVSDSVQHSFPCLKLSCAQPCRQPWIRHSLKKA